MLHSQKGDERRTLNRAERRKNGIKQPPPKMKHISEAAYNNAINFAYRKGYDNAFEKASNIAVAYMMAVPLLVLNDHFNEIRLKQVNGKSRVENFFDRCIDVFDEYNDGEDTLSRLVNDVEEKTGFKISERVFDDTAEKIV